MPQKLLFLLLIVSMGSCSVFRTIPQPRTEFRGFWVATVVNIDWPKDGNDSTEKQKKDFLEILDFYEALNFNAAIVQIRTAGDAFYSSHYAPWSRFLTGIEGEAPPSKTTFLSWMINETHERGMEFHAWLNPYRATFDLNTEILNARHDFNMHPDWMVKYGKKYYYDPGIPEVRKRLVAITNEVVNNYDIDAIHFDDYFYPYKIKNEVFNDSNSFEKYGQIDQDLSDWRRSNVDSLVKNIHRNIASYKPWVQFGISPFGVWRNNDTDARGSNTKAGQTTYDDLYADPLLWMQQRWIDYIAPQAYWSMNLPAASHKTIVEWWAENSPNSNLYIGNGPYKIRNNADKAWRKRRELPEQIALSRETEQVRGNVFFSAKSLMQNNRDVKRLLKRNFYKYRALTPVSPLASKQNNDHSELLSVSGSKNELSLHFTSLKNQRYALLYDSKNMVLETYPMKALIDKKFLNGKNSITITKKYLRKRKQIAVTLLNNFGQESVPMLIDLKELHDPKR